MPPTALVVEKVSVPPANVNDGRAGDAVIPDEPYVFADKRLSRYPRLHGDPVRRRQALRGGGRALVGGRRTGDADTPAGLEPADPSRPRPDRKDLRYVDAKLWAPLHVMARSRQSYRSGSLHRHRLQSQTAPQHSRHSTLISPKHHAAIRPGVVLLAVLGRHGYAFRNAQTTVRSDRR